VLIAGICKPEPFCQFEDTDDVCLSLPDHHIILTKKILEIKI
jgi:hypothetical protein